jgi:hypothetical protein
MSKNIVCLGMALLLVASVGAADTKDPAELKEFVCKSGEFSIMLPGKAKENRPGGKESPLVTVQLQTKKGTYMASSFGAPKDAQAKVPTIPGFPNLGDLGNLGKMNVLRPDDQGYKTLADARDFWVVKTSKGAKLDGEPKRLKLDEKTPILESTIILGDKRILRHRICMIGVNTYQWSATGSKDFVTSDEADKVLDSFKLTKDK